jgi:nucleotide-binding universal stress UspA family protein
MIKRILFPTKFEDFSLEILKRICCLKSEGLEAVILAHVIDTHNPYNLFSQGKFSLVVNLTEIRDAAMERLSYYADYLRSQEVESKTIVAAGPLVSEIMAIAKEEEASLIVTGRQTKGLIGDLLFGSNADRIIREAPVPVLTLGQLVGNGTLGEAVPEVCEDMFRKILFAVDWSAETERAKQYLQVLRQMGASDIVVVHVASESDSAVEGAEESMADREEELRRLNDELRENGFEPRGYLVQGGKSDEEINRIAAQEEISMIVIGSQGKSLKERILKGSVSRRVLKDSEKPVLVVR